MWELDNERNSSSLQEYMPRAEETGYRKSRNVRQDASSTVKNELAGGTEEWLSLENGRRWGREGAGEEKAANSSSYPNIDSFTDLSSCS